MPLTRVVVLLLYVAAEASSTPGAAERAPARSRTTGRTEGVVERRGMVRTRIVFTQRNCAPPRDVGERPPLERFLRWVAHLPLAWAWLHMVSTYVRVPCEAHSDLADAP